MQKIASKLPTYCATKVLFSHKHNYVCSVYKHVFYTIGENPISHNVSLPWITFFSITPKQYIAHGLLNSVVSTTDGKGIQSLEWKRERNKLLGKA
jgi:hypothetical protein